MEWQRIQSYLHRFISLRKSVSSPRQCLWMFLLFSVFLWYTWNVCDIFKTRKINTSSVFLYKHYRIFFQSSVNNKALHECEWVCSSTVLTVHVFCAARAQGRGVDQTETLLPAVPTGQCWDQIQEGMLALVSRVTCQKA